MPTSTTNYGWQKPDIGASTDAWGGLLNTDLDGIDSTVKSISNVANAALPSATASSTYVAKAGDTMTGALNINVTSVVSSIVVAPTAATPANIVLNKAAGQGASVYAQQAGQNRWQMAIANQVAESGSNAGSDFQLVSFADAGAQLGTPMQIWRATATVAFNAVGATAYSGAAGVGDSNVILNKAGSTHVAVVRGASNGLFRWGLTLGDNTGEGGSNAGSNFSIASYTDAGAGLATPLSIVRSTGVCTFSQPIVNGSDRRLKSAVEPVTDALAIVQQLAGVFYQHAGADQRQVGLIAQDVAPVLPEVVFECPVAPDDPLASQFSEAEPMLGISYPNMIAVLIEAVKELAAQVAALQAPAARARRG